MLRVEPAQVIPLQGAADAQFRAEICRMLQEDFPQYARLRPPVLDRIVGCGLDRATSYGLASCGAKARFVALMAGVAPTFDQHPLVHSLLVAADLDDDERLEALPDQVTDSDWKDIERHAGNVGWFWTNDVFEADVVASVGVALTNALPANQRLQLNPAWLREHCTRAVSRGWRSIDGCFVFSAASLLFGSEFEYGERGVVWARDVFSAEHPRVQTALLRMRIALECGIWL